MRFREDFRISFFFIYAISQVNKLDRVVNRGVSSIQAAKRSSIKGDFVKHKKSIPYGYVKRA